MAVFTTGFKSVACDAGRSRMSAMIFKMLIMGLIAKIEARSNNVNHMH